MAKSLARTACLSVLIASSLVASPAPTSSAREEAVPAGGRGEFSVVQHRDATRGGGLPHANWRACGVFDSRYKVVHDYKRRHVHRRMVGKVGRLYCGMRDDNGSEHAFGYWHIKDGHEDEWQAWASRVGANWRDLAGWSIKHVLRDPDKVQNQSRRSDFASLANSTITIRTAIRKRSRFASTWEKPRAES